MFVEQYTELWNAVDPIAERIRALGHLAPARMPVRCDEFAEGRAGPHRRRRSTWWRSSPTATGGRAHGVKRLRGGRRGERPTERRPADARLNVHEKTAWMLRSLLLARRGASRYCAGLAPPSRRPAKTQPARVRRNRARQRRQARPLDERKACRAVCSARLDHGMGVVVQAPRLAHDQVGGGEAARPGSARCPRSRHRGARSSRRGLTQAAARGTAATRPPLGRARSQFDGARRGIWLPPRVPAPGHRLAPLRLRPGSAPEGGVAASPRRALPAAPPCRVVIGAHGNGRVACIPIGAAARLRSCSTSASWRTRRNCGCRADRAALRARPRLGAPRSVALLQRQLLRPQGSDLAAHRKLGRPVGLGRGTGHPEAELRAQALPQRIVGRRSGQRSPQGAPRRCRPRSSLVHHCATCAMPSAAASVAGSRRGACQAFTLHGLRDTVAAAALRNHAGLQLQVVEAAPPAEQAVHQPAQLDRRQAGADDDRVAVGGQGPSRRCRCVTGRAPPAAGQGLRDAVIDTPAPTAALGGADPAACAG